MAYIGVVSIYGHMRGVYWGYPHMVLAMVYGCIVAYFYTCYVYVIVMMYVCMNVDVTSDE